MKTADNYHIWKDPACNGVDPEYEVKTRKEYFEWINDPDPAVRAARRARHFIFVDDDHGHCEAMETTKPKCRAWDADRKDYHRRESDRKTNELSLDQMCEDGELFLPAEPESDPAYRSEEKELHDWLMDALKRVPERYRDMARLIYIDNSRLPLRAVARKTGIPFSTVQYAEKKIRAWLVADYLRNCTRLTGD